MNLFSGDISELFFIHLCQQKNLIADAQHTRALADPYQFAVLLARTLYMWCVVRLLCAHASDLGEADLPTYDHRFARQEVQFGRILLQLAGHPSPTPPTKEKE